MSGQFAPIVLGESTTASGGKLRKAGMGAKAVKRRRLADAAIPGVSASPSKSDDEDEEAQLSPPASPRSAKAAKLAATSTPCADASPTASSASPTASSASSVPPTSPVLASAQKSGAFAERKRKAPAAAPTAAATAAPADSEADAPDTSSLVHCKRVMFSLRSYCGILPQFVDATPDEPGEYAGKGVAHLPWLLQYLAGCLALQESSGEQSDEQESSGSGSGAALPPVNGVADAARAELRRREESSVSLSSTAEQAPSATIDVDVTRIAMTQATTKLLPNSYSAEAVPVLAVFLSAPVVSAVTRHINPVFKSNTESAAEAAASTALVPAAAASQFTMTVAAASRPADPNLSLVGQVLQAVDVAQAVDANKYMWQTLYLLYTCHAASDAQMALARVQQRAFANVKEQQEGGKAADTSGVAVLNKLMCLLPGALRCAAPLMIEYMDELEHGVAAWKFDDLVKAKVQPGDVDEGRAYVDQLTWLLLETDASHERVLHTNLVTVLHIVQREARQRRQRSAALGGASDVAGSHLKTMMRNIRALDKAARDLLHSWFSGTRKPPVPEKLLDSVVYLLFEVKDAESHTRVMPVDVMFALASARQKYLKQHPPPPPQEEKEEESSAVTDTTTAAAAAKTDEPAPTDTVAAEEQQTESATQAAAAGSSSSSSSGGEEEAEEVVIDQRVTRSKSGAKPPAVMTIELIEPAAGTDTDSDEPKSEAKSATEPGSDEESEKNEPEDDDDMNGPPPGIDDTPAAAGKGSRHKHSTPDRPDKPSLSALWEQRLKEAADKRKAAEAEKQRLADEKKRQKQPLTAEEKNELMVATFNSMYARLKQGAEAKIDTTVMFKEAQKAKKLMDAIAAGKRQKVKESK